MKKRKLKTKKKQIIIISCVFLVILLVIILITTSNVKVGKIKNGKALYIDRIVNVTNYKDKNKVVIEFENNKELIDNCIITTELYEQFKNKDAKYNLTIKDYLKSNDISAKENYNINKSLQMKYIDEDTSYMDYFAMTCGFKNKKELMKYTNAVIKLASKEK
mgnify:FL=1